MEPRGWGCTEGQNIWQGQRDGPTWDGQKLLFGQDLSLGFAWKKVTPGVGGPYCSSFTQFLGLALSPGTSE